MICWGNAPTSADFWSILSGGKLSHLPVCSLPHAVEPYFIIWPTFILHLELIFNINKMVKNRKMSHKVAIA